MPTYGGGNPKKALPPQVRRFLNDRDNRGYIRGVIASGNTNFGDAFCAAGHIIAAKCRVPLMYCFELMGTPEDRQRVRAGLADFFSRNDAHNAAPADASSTTAVAALAVTPAAATATPIRGAGRA